MTPESLCMEAHPKLKGTRMVLGLTGWMDGGDVSTGTIRRFVQALGASRLATIQPRDFYVWSFPGSMEVAAMFRPHTKIEDGVIVSYDLPDNIFHYSQEHNLILFHGKEPNLRWNEYAHCILSLASSFHVEMMYFIGSVGGLVPHTREPRLFSSVSDEDLKPALQAYGVRFSNYEGPASIVTLLMREAARRGLRMATLVAEIPAYIQGHNPRCIESMVRRLSGVLEVEIALEPLRQATDVFEKKLNKVLDDRKELAQLIGKLESDYDNEIFDTEMGDLKQWLESQGVRLD